MKKIYFFVILISSMANAQKFFTLDEMLDIALCKNADCFKKAALTNGYKYVNTLYFKQDPNYSFADYEDSKLNQYGLKNHIAWKSETTKKGVMHSANFVTNSETYFNNLAKEIDKRQYAFIKNENKGNMLSPNFEMNSYYRKGNTGILINMHETADAKGNSVTAYIISITTPCTPNWPNDL